MSVRTWIVSAARNMLSAARRRARLGVTACVLLVVCGCVDSSPPSEHISFGRFHELRIYRPPGAPAHLALLLSGDGGWGAGLSSIARRLAARGTLTAGIDSRVLLEGYREGGCVSPGEDLAELARYLHKRYRVADASAVLLGHSAGATLVYVALAQSRAGTFAGALTLSFCADLDLAAPLCPALPAAARPGGARLLPGAALPQKWIDLHGLDDEVCPAPEAQAFVAGSPGAEFVPLPGITHSYHHQARWWPQFISAYKRVSGSPVGSRR